MAEQKRGRGAPTAEERRINRENRAKKNLAEQVLKGNELIAENYYQYMEAMNDYALGNIPQATITNRLSSLKWCLERAEKLLEQAEAEEHVDLPDAPVEEKTTCTKQSQNLLQFAR